jgi:ribonuclease, rne/rng family
LPPSKFGLIQITRQRVRQELNIKTKEENPSKEGEIEAPIVLIDKINIELESIIKEDAYKGRIVLNAHPFIAAYLTKGFLNSIRFKWFLKYKRWIKILPRDAYSYLEYRFKTNEGTPL